jgi:hypothetical protein
MMHRMELLVLTFLLAVGPLALVLGADSRVDDPLGWWPGHGRPPTPGLPPAGRRRPRLPGRRRA